MIIRDDRTTNSPPGIAMSMSPEYPLDGDTVGPMATITDSLFSLIIFIYVMVTFLYLFYGFCWIDAPKKTQADLEEENKLVGPQPWAPERTIPA